MTQEVPFEDMQKDASFTSSEILELIHYRLCMPGTQLQLIQRSRFTRKEHPSLKVSVRIGTTNLTFLSQLDC